MIYHGNQIIVGNMRPRSTNPATCQNPRCNFYLMQDGKDIIKQGRNANGHQLYRCLHCGKTFVETRNSPAYRRHLPGPEICKICGLSIQKLGHREIERITGHHRDTIGRLLMDLSKNPQATTRYLLYSMKFTKNEIDELLKIVSKSKNGRSPAGDSPNGGKEAQE